MDVYILKHRYVSTHRNEWITTHIVFFWISILKYTSTHAMFYYIPFR